MSQTFAGHFRRGEGGGGRLMIAEIITETASSFSTPQSSPAVYNLQQRNTNLGQIDLTSLGNKGFVIWHK